MLIFMRTELERRRTRNVLMRYVPPGVATRMAANPDRLKLGGETRDMTIMFSDIRGFTTRSEKMSAEQLTRFINRFLTPMTTVIQEHDGTIDKYMGDAIMAFWNAPQDVQAHPRVAADAALGMIAALEALNRELETEAKATGQGFEPVAIGIGINTGTVSVGNMGSEQRFDYSVIGDDVNLASRLEGRSKSYGVVIVLGERTASRLGEDYAVLELDRLRVKGKTKPVTIFTLLGGAEIARSTWFTTLRENHDAMLRHYRGCEWDAAESACAEAGRHAGGRLDAYYELYAERIADFRVTPPPSDWDGVEIATEK
jgi:adenylate cyclase